jgi:hypothetical protein
LKKKTPVFQYAPNSWGPSEVERVTPPGGWQDPIVAHETPSLATHAA